MDVYFDDDLLEIYGDVSVATSKIRKVMAYVQNMFLQKDTLKTTIQLNYNVEHKSGEEWALAMAYAMI